MIDLRSDTITLPTREMLETVLSARLGDAGRPGTDLRGEDETTNALEDLAAELTGKEAAAYFPTGTLANTTALLTWCKPGDRVLVDEMQHLYCHEKIAFESRFGQLVAVCYPLAPKGGADPEAVETLLAQKPALLCLENTHNYSGGKVVGLRTMQRIGEAARRHGVPVHLDGARIFNAAAAQGVQAKALCATVDSVMFCISKGLGAPIGSLLCGTLDFIRRARKLRAPLGGTMRQSGVAASCGIYALEHNIGRLSQDHANAALLVREVGALSALAVDPDVQSNMVLLNCKKSGVSPRELCRILEEEGVRALPLEVPPDSVRMTFHLGISEEDTRLAAMAVRRADRRLAER